MIETREWEMLTGGNPSGMTGGGGDDWYLAQRVLRGFPDAFAAVRQAFRDEAVASIDGDGEG